jgi:tryptophan-rich sensory protein
MKPIITAAQLEAVNACAKEVALFRKTFGESTVVTVAKARKVASLFDWGFGTCLLDDEGRAEYERVRGPAWAEYKRVEGPAWAEYKRVEGPAWAEYKRVRGPAWAEYKRVEGPAWASAYIATCKRRAA